MSSVQKLGVPVILFTIIAIHGSVKSSKKGSRFLFATNVTVTHVLIRIT